jgi:Sulfotransferase domain
MPETLPNFIHIGPGKSGSTWLHEVLMTHPEMYFPEAKDLYFFSRYYDRGIGWYSSQFRGARPEHKIIGEVCPNYFMWPEAPERMRESLGPDLRLMVTLREPAERAFSSYLYYIRQGLATPTFIQATQEVETLLNEGRYATNLRRYLRCFDRKQVHIGVFDDLEADPQAFLDDVTDWLQISRHVLTAEQLEARLPASKPRSLALAAAVGHVATWVRRHDGAGLVGSVRRSKLVERMLYRPLGDDKPTMSPEDIAFVREQLSGEIAGVEEEFGIDLRQRWGWA